MAPVDVPPAVPLTPAPTPPGDAAPAVGLAPGEIEEPPGDVAPDAGAVDVALEPGVAMPEPPATPALPAAPAPGAGIVLATPGAPGVGVDPGGVLIVLDPAVKAGTATGFDNTNGAALVPPPIQPVSIIV